MYISKPNSDNVGPSNSRDNDNYANIPDWISKNIKKKLLSRGIKRLYSPQYEAISQYFATKDKNMVVSIPTASGKTLIAEIIIFETLIKSLPDRRKSVYIAPQRSIVFEIFRKFTAVWGNEFKIVNSVGDYGEGDEKLLEADVIIMTNEKADSIIRINPNFMDKISVFVVDEAHTLGDGERGQTLEFLLSRILYQNLNKRQDNLIQCRILALSATIGNIDSFSDWLSAILIKSDWRPTKLVKGIYLINTPYYVKEYFASKEIAESYISDNYLLEYASTLENMIKSLCNVEKQAIIFVNTRKEAEEYCVYLRQALGDRDSFGSNPVAIDFHHAGRTIKEQKTIIERFEKGELHFLIATSTIAAGINLPANYVIIAGVKRYAGQNNFISYSVNQYLQMAGRAGRPDFGSNGFSVILCNNKKEALEMFDRYCLGTPEPLVSQISAGELSKHLLALVDANIIKCLDDCETFFKHTFYCKTNTENIDSLKKKCKEILIMLRKRNLIISEAEKIEESEFATTKFGGLVTKLYISPLTAYQMRIMIQQIMKFPNRYCIQNGDTFKIPKVLFYNIISHTENAYSFYFKSDDLRLVQLFMNEFKNNLFYSYNDFLHDYNNYCVEKNQLSDYRKEFQRELTAIKGTMILWMYSNGISVEKIAESANIGKGDVYSSIMQADWLIHALYNLCIHFGLFNSKYFSAAKTDFKVANKSLSLGVPQELFDLMRIQSMGRLMAREFFDVGYKSVNNLSKIDVQQFSDTLIFSQIKTIKNEAMMMVHKVNPHSVVDESEDLSYKSDEQTEVVHRIVSTEMMLRAMDE